MFQVSQRLFRASPIASSPLAFPVRLCVGLDIGFAVWPSPASLSRSLALTLRYHGASSTRGCLPVFSPAIAELDKFSSIF